jgi:hypothetical protein
MPGGPLVSGGHTGPPDPSGAIFPSLRPDLKPHSGPLSRGTGSAGVAVAGRDGTGLRAARVAPNLDSADWPRQRQRKQHAV